jgi:hypothetical protein
MTHSASKYGARGPVQVEHYVGILGKWEKEREELTGRVVKILGPDRWAYMTKGFCDCALNLLFDIGGYHIFVHHCPAR